MAQGLDESEQFTHHAMISRHDLCIHTELACQIYNVNKIIVVVFRKEVHVRFGTSFYEPYVMLFPHTAPFEIHSISTKPFWINGWKSSLEAKRDAGDDIYCLDQLGEPRAKVSWLY